MTGTLDDYDDVYWTSGTVTIATPRSPDIVYSTLIGHYVRIGNIVDATFKIMASTSRHSESVDPDLIVDEGL